jgi:hypothetical protein
MSIAGLLSKRWCGNWTEKSALLVLELVLLREERTPKLFPGGQGVILVVVSAWDFGVEEGLWAKPPQAVKANFDHVP